MLANLHDVFFAVVSAPMNTLQTNADFTVFDKKTLRTQRLQGILRGVQGPSSGPLRGHGMEPLAQQTLICALKLYGATLK